MKNWLKIFVLFFLLGLFLYGNGLNNKFVIDDYFFASNPLKTDLTYAFHQWPFYREQSSSALADSLWFYRPLAYIGLDLYFAVFKDHLWAYHLVNLFLFVFAASLVYALIKKLTTNNSLAFLTSLFFLVHPINGVILSNISSGYFTVVVILVLGAMLLLLGSLERKNDRILYFLSLILSFLSLFCHEIGIFIPLYAACLVVLFRKDPFRTKAAYLLPYILIIFFYGIFRSLILMPNENISRSMALYHMTFWEHLATLFKLYAWYISKLFYPQGIVMLWTQPIVHVHITLNIIGLCLLAVLFLLFFVKFSKEKICQLALVWVFIGFVPVCLAAFRTPKEGAIIEPHWFIFSSIGFFILVAYYCLDLLDRRRMAGLVLLCIIIVLWGSAARANNQLWKDQLTYARYWSQQNPYSKKVYLYLAEAYQRQGDLRASARNFKLALSGNSFIDEVIYIKLENIDIEEGHLKEAELNCHRALRVDPNSAGTYDNLGAIYYAQGRLDKARECLEKALVLDGSLTQPRVGLASIYLKRSEYQKAIDLCLMNLKIANDDTETLFFLIDIYAIKKDIINMKKYAYQLIDSKTDPKILMRLGIKLAGMNMNDIALDCYTKVLHLAPDDQDAYYEAGKLLFNIGKYDGAIHIWKLGSNIDLSDQRFAKGIAQAMKLKGAFLNNS